MAPPHYEMTTQHSGDSSTAYGIVCFVDGFAVAQYRDISQSSEFVSEMTTLFNTCELSPERMKQAIVTLLP